jgi:hypothetical protein
MPSYIPVGGVDQFAAILSAANSAMRRGDYLSALNAYEILRRQGHSQSAHIGLNIQLCRNRLLHSEVVAPNHLHKAATAPKLMSHSVGPVVSTAEGSRCIQPPSRVSVALTTIDSRLPHLHRVIDVFVGALY